MNQTIGDRVRSLREAKGLTRQELASVSGLKQNWIFDLETGKMESPGIRNLLRIAEVMGISIGELCYGDDADLREVRLSLRPDAKWSTNDVEGLRKILKGIVDAWEEQRRRTGT